MQCSKRATNSKCNPYVKLNALIIMATILTGLCKWLLVLHRYKPSSLTYTHHHNCEFWTDIERAIWQFCTNPSCKGKKMFHKLLTLLRHHSSQECHVQSVGPVRLPFFTKVVHIFGPSKLDSVEIRSEIKIYTCHYNSRIVDQVFQAIIYLRQFLLGCKWWQWHKW